MNEQTSPIKILASEIAWSCPWYSVRRDEILLPGGQRGEYNVVQHPGAVWIVPVTPAGEIVMIYSYRHAVQDWCWEVPAGGLAPGQQGRQALGEGLLGVSSLFGALAYEEDGAEPGVEGGQELPVDIGVAFAVVSADLPVADQDPAAADVG